MDSESLICTLMKNKFTSYHNVFINSYFGLYTYSLHTHTFSMLLKAAPFFLLSFSVIWFICHRKKLFAPVYIPFFSKVSVEFCFTLLRIQSSLCVSMRVIWWWPLRWPQWPLPTGVCSLTLLLSWSMDWAYWLTYNNSQVEAGGVVSEIRLPDSCDYYLDYALTTSVSQSQFSSCEKP